LQPVNDGFTRRSRKKPEMVADVPATGTQTSHFDYLVIGHTDPALSGKLALNIHICLAILPRSKEGSSGNRQWRCSWKYGWCVVQRLVQSAPFEHPALRCDETAPIGKAGNEAQVFDHMLLANQPDRNGPAIRIDDRRAKERLEHEYAFGMVPQGPVPRVCKDGLRLVEPLVEFDIVSGRAAPFSHR
jgi:hypothetical protein